MKYNGYELNEINDFDNIPRDMLVWNDNDFVPVIRQVVCKLNSDKPWLAVLKGEHQENNDDSFGGWQHAAFIPDIKMMSLQEFADFIKNNSNAMWRQGDKVYGSISISDEKDWYTEVKNVTIRFIDNPLVDVLPTKRLYTEWKSQWLKEQSAIKSLLK